MKTMGDVPTYSISLACDSSVYVLVVFLYICITTTITITSGCIYFNYMDMNSAYLVFQINCLILKSSKCFNICFDIYKFYYLQEIRRILL